MKDFDQSLRSSALFAGALKSEIRPNVIVALLVFFALWGGSLLLGRGLAAPLLQTVFADSPTNTAAPAALRKVLVCGVQIAAFFLWVRCIEKRPVVSMGFGGLHRIRAYVGSAALGMVSITCIVTVLMLSGAIKLHPVSPLSPGRVLLPVMIAMPGWIIQSASEEIAIRGWLIPVVGARYGPLRAVIITGCAFGAIHLLNTGATFLSLVNLALSGVFFALYAIRQGRIWGVCGLHMGWNFAQGNLFGVSISGERSNNAMFVCETTGGDLLSGGAFGPEASPVTTVFLIGGILVTGAILWRGKSAQPREC